MSFILEVLSEFLFEGVIYTSTNIKISKWIRYPLLIIIIGFLGFIAFGLFMLGCKLLAKEPLIAIFFFAMGIMVVYYVISMFRKRGKR